jgi:hypothetical protein
MVASVPNSAKEGKVGRKEGSRRVFEKKRRKKLLFTLGRWR